MSRNLSVLIAAFLSCAVAQAADVVTPAIRGVVAAGTAVEFIKDGFDGTEGPVPWADDSVLFTENRAGRIQRIAADGSITVFLEETNRSNSLAVNARGELVTVQTGKPAVGILHPAASARTLVDQFEGTPLTRPNDLVIDRRGGIYFTDPNGKVPAFFYFSRAGVLSRLATDILLPNGIQLSPDEKTLYVADTYGPAVFSYPVRKDGSLGARREFAQLQGVTKTPTGVSSGADGLAIDAKGRLYVATTAGVQVFDRKGAALGILTLPQAPQNLAFAGPGKKWLYVVGRGAVYRVETLTHGYRGRVK